MAAKNDITGDSIKSKILSEEGRKNWDNIFGKKTILEWVKLKRVSIYNYDHHDLDERVTEEEFKTLNDD